ncbi:MAG: hypothetical protein R3F61_04680 [Myxococcota bacterium]
MRREVLKRVRETERPVVVFDIDSTLLSTERRHHRILREFADQHGDADLVSHVASLSPADFGWEVHQPLVGTPFDADPLRSALTAFWWERFFHPAYVAEDAPVPGAVDFVNKVHRAGAWVYYLTARHLPDLGAATVESLLRHGFPLATGRTLLHLKPDRAVGDKPFKKAAMRDIAQLGEVVATFENDPANANTLVEGFPGAIHVLLDTVRPADAPEPHPDLVWVSDFR